MLASLTSWNAASIRCLCKKKRRNANLIGKNPYRISTVIMSHRLKTTLSILNGNKFRITSLNYSFISQQQSWHALELMKCVNLNYKTYWIKISGDGNFHNLLVVVYTAADTSVPTQRHPTPPPNSCITHFRNIYIFA